MRRFIILTIIGLSVLMPYSANAGIWDDIKDVIMQLDEDNFPTRSSQFKFSSSDWFDAKLHVSLKYNYHTVTVRMNSDYSVYDMPARMERWLAKSRDKTAKDINRKVRNGKVLVCKPDSTEFGVFKFLAKKLFKIGKSYVTYKPVNDYDAYIHVDDINDVKYVKFFHKRSDRTRPSGCVNYYDYVSSSNSAVNY